MSNELLLFCNLLLVYSLVLIWHRCFGKTGLIAYVVLASVLANVEVSAQIQAFGLHQTLGNILFASTFLATDILSEYHSREDANQAVHCSILGCLSFLIISQFWLYFIPVESDLSLSHLQALSSNAPRIIISSFLVFVISEKLDIYLYHKLWNWRGAGTHHYLWLRNNLATLISQAVNAILFNLLAFYGVFPNEIIWEICFTTFIIYIATSLLDTPFVYLAKRKNPPA